MSSARSGGNVLQFNNYFLVEVIGSKVSSADTAYLWEKGQAIYMYLLLTGTHFGSPYSLQRLFFRNFFKTPHPAFGCVVLPCDHTLCQHTYFQSKLHKFLMLYEDLQ